MNLITVSCKIYLLIEPFLAKKITGPRGRYSAAHDHFADKQIDPIVLIVFLSTIVFLLLAMIIQHHNHMKQIKAHNEELLKHHKALHAEKSKENSTE